MKDASRSSRPVIAHDPHRSGPLGSDDEGSRRGRGLRAFVPTVSIVIPCYRRGDLLLECLRSVLSQDRADWEAIVVDDGTPGDEVERAVADVSDERIRYIRHDANRGGAAAMNTGCSAARGSFLLPVGSDDMLEPSFLRLTLTKIRSEIALDCVFTDYQLFGSSDRLVKQRVGSPRELLIANWLPCGGTLQRRSIWERVGGYCESPHLRAMWDWDYWIGATEEGISPAHIPEPLYRYRIHEGSISASRSPHECGYRDLIYQRHKKVFDQARLGGRFRAGGYLKCSYASFQHGDPLMGLWFALRGLKLDPFNEALWRQIPKSFLPERALNTIRRLRLGSADLIQQC